MKISEKVRIGSADYKVILTDETIVLNSNECKGTIDYEFHEIKISNRVQDKHGQEKTFLHEIVHGIIRERNLDIHSTDEETLVDEIAIGLHQIIRDNQEIFIDTLMNEPIYNPDTNEKLGTIITNSKGEFVGATN